jgi:hypothetical protein
MKIKEDIFYFGIRFDDFEERETEKRKVINNNHNRNHNNLNPNPFRFRDDFQVIPDTFFWRLVVMSDWGELEKIKI